jgi:hypothetical protein
MCEQLAGVTDVVNLAGRFGPSVAELECLDA